MFPDSHDVILAALIFSAALLYASVGHGGASGYLAAMALLGIAPAVMKPTALTLNILVASIALFKFYRGGYFSWKLFWPLAITSIPCAYLGGLLTLPGHFYKPLVGCVLIYAAVWSFYSSQKYSSQKHTSQQSTAYAVRQPARHTLIVTGALLGFLSGLTGVGGGIFLSPLLLFFRWAELKVISGVAAAFILVNSIAGLAGVLSKSSSLPATLPLWALAAVIGGFIGAEYGSRRLRNPVLQKLLAAVLAIAGTKMIFLV